MEKPGSWTYRGTCETCGKYFAVNNQTVADNATERLRDASYMINHEHGRHEGHLFNGNVECVHIPREEQQPETDNVREMHRRRKSAR